MPTITPIMASVEATKPTKTYAAGQRVLVWVTVRNTRDDGHHIVELSGATCRPSRIGLEVAEPSVEDLLAALRARGVTIERQASAPDAPDLPLGSPSVGGPGDPAATVPGPNDLTGAPRRWFRRTEPDV